MTHDGDDVFDDEPDDVLDDDPDTIRDRVKKSVTRDDEENRRDTLRDVAELTVPFLPEGDSIETETEIVELSSLEYTNIVFDDALFDQDDEAGSEEHQSIATSIPGLRADVVFRDEELSFVELEWSPESGLVFPATTEMIDAVYQKAARMGYPLSLLLRRVMTDLEGGRHIERHIVIFHSEPKDGDGTGVSIELQLGLDLDDEDYGRPAQAELLRNKWVERVTELVKQAYPRAQMHTMICDHDADEVQVSTPLGVDPTDFEWRLDDLIEEATDEVVEKSS